MTAAQLRQSILQAAAQGRLVPQNAHDEPASELLKRIQAEKARLIKEGKIKKEKPLPPITEDEVPYDLPEGWVWCRLGEVIRLTSGQHIESSQYNTKKEGLAYLTGPTDFGTISTKISKWTLVPKVIVPKGVLLITVKGSGVGSLNFLSEEAAIGRQLMAINSIVISLAYLYIFLSTQRQCFSNKKIGIAIPGIGREDILDQELPLPPLAEQQRIVAKVDELMALCDELEAAEKELDTLESDFTERLPKSILQAAVQGKLVPQNVHDEPASALLERIRTEKAKLIKQGKIKKVKSLPPVTEDEVPYNLPEGWVWCRLNDVCEYIQRGRSPKYSELEEVPVLSQKCVQWGNVTLDKAKFIEPNTLRAYGEERLLKSGDLLWNSTGHGTLGRIAQFNIQEAKYPKVVADSHVTVIRGMSGYVDSRYLLGWFSGPTVQDEIVGKSSGSTNQIELATSTIKSYIVPFPPLAEQQRIVAKLDELMALCNELKTVGALPIAPASSATIIPFPVRTTAPEEPAVEEEYLIAARGDLQETVSAAHRQARRKVFEDETDA